MSDPRNLRDPALGGDPALDPVVPGRGRRPMGFGGPLWLIAILVAIVIAAAIWGFGGWGYGGWGYGGGFGRRGAGGADNGVPVYGGAAPANAPAPAPAGNGSGR